jgi:superfamily I DNA/RNA helicase
LAKLSEWQTVQIDSHRNSDGKIKRGKELLVNSIQDRVDTIKVLCEDCTELDEVREKITNMFGDTKDGEEPKKVTLSTVHKAKGREWNTVYILGFNELMPFRMASMPWQKIQENNLIYVAVTRAKQNLIMIG